MRAPPKAPKSLPELLYPSLTVATVASRGKSVEDVGDSVATVGGYTRGCGYVATLAHDGPARAYRT